MESDYLEKEFKNKDEMKEADQLNLIKFQIKIIRFFCILPPKNAYKVAWKYYTYVVTTILGFLLYCFMAFGSLGAVFQNWGNLSLITEILFIMVAAVDNCVMSLYFILHRTRLEMLLNMLETRFTKHINAIIVPRNKDKILNRVSRRSSLITRAVLCNVISVMLGWTCLPMLLRIIDLAANEMIEETDSNIWKYFCVIIWHPEGFSQLPMYGILYIIGAACICVAICQYTASNMIFFFFMYHTSTHFELLISCIHNMDYINDFKINNTTNDEINTGVNNKQDMCCSNQNHNETKSLEERINEYFKECIKYHQDILEYSNEVNEFISPMLLVYFLFNEMMMCLAVFQLVIDEGDGILRFLSGVANVCLWPLVICWCGEYMITKSLEFQRSLYEYQWYSRSPRFKKMLHITMMQAQQPVRCTAGKFFDVSLESFANIANKVYAYFTILKEMYDS